MDTHRCSSMEFGLAIWFGLKASDVDAIETGSKRVV